MRHDTQMTAYPPPPPPSGDSSRTFPYHFGWPLLVGLITGIAFRLVFSAKPGEPYATMMISFLFLAPLAIGVVTVYIAERRGRQTFAYYAGIPALANVLFVIGTLLINLEGIICAILIVPLFAIIGAIGGVLMGVIVRWTNWPKQATYSFLLLPLVFGAFEQRLPLPRHVADVSRTGYVEASPDEVWRQIQEADGIAPAEVDSAWMVRIGVPTPRAGVTRQLADGRVRTITMGRGVHFDQRITDWQPGRYMRAVYDFAPDSFPPRALDDHVKIGGHYFDIVDTDYTLVPHGRGTQLTIRLRYRVSTQFNWYADPIAQWLVGDLEDTLLAFYKHRSEHRFRPA